VAIGWLRDGIAAESAAAQIRAMGRQAMAITCDVTIEGDVRACFDAVQRSFGRLDILVANAGIQRPQPITKMTVADWDTMMQVHLRGAFLCAREAARLMMAQRGGRIITVCSQLGYIGRGDYTAYSTAKGGLLAFTRALAKELAPHGVLVNGVSPGLVDTGFDPLSEEVKAAHAASLPLGRLGTVEDMTSAFVFLASDEARYYCGQMLHPNGGEIMP
jgi:3-oxoacyl-[acyl-carrier protein] reductase